MTYPIKQISDLVIYHNYSYGIPITPLKLQKVLYYLQAWMYTLNNVVLFEELPQAWVNGPVYPSVYKEYRKLYRHDTIRLNESLEEIQQAAKNSFEELNLQGKAKKDFIDILQYFSNKSDLTLVQRTHSESPWINARRGLGPFDASDRKITLDSMRDYYKKSLNNN